MTGKKKLPIGIDIFEKLDREEFYYVDKTGMIEDLLQNRSEVNLFTRPRRFGKSLNIVSKFLKSNTSSSSIRRSISLRFGSECSSSLENR